MLNTAGYNSNNNGKLPALNQRSMPRQIEKGSIEWQHKHGHQGLQSPQPQMSGPIVGSGGLT